MRSLKIKLVFIANITSLLMLIVLGIFSFYFSKDVLFEKVVEMERNNLTNVKVSMDAFSDASVLALEKLRKEIMRLSYDQLSSESAIVENVTPLFKAFKMGGGFLAVYVGVPLGKLIADDSEVPDGQDYRIFGGDASCDAISRGWYKGAVANNSLFISDIYNDVVTGLPCFTYATPLVKDGKMVGVLAVDLLVSALQAQVDALPGNTLYL